MNKRYQVFVSSTYDDLKGERLEVMKALLELDCIPCGMEYFPAADEDQWTYIRNLINDCDYYIVIIGGCYGSEDLQGISYTEKEYEYAVTQGIPTIAFIVNDREKLPAEKKEKSDKKKEKLDKFISLVKSKLCKPWSSPHELGAVVSRSLTQLIKRSPRTGWVKANKVGNEEMLSEIHNLRKENEMLKGKLTKEESSVKLNETEKDILLHFSQNEGGRLTHSSVVRQFGKIPETKVLYHLEKLKRRYYIDYSQYSDTWFLKHLGRKYLVDRKSI